MAHAARHIIHEIYSDVMFELAEETGLVDGVMDDLEAVGKIFEAEPEFLTLLTVGQLKDDEKNRIIRRVFGGRVNELTLDFLCVLARRNRLNFLFGIQDRYQNLMDQFHNVQRLEITLAREPNNAQLAKLKADLMDAIRAEVKLAVQVDPDILGGIVIKKGDMVIDNSVRSILNRTVDAVMNRSKEALDKNKKKTDTQ
jgi:F-type H+-transporting ATPase subunit delta